MSVGNGENVEKRIVVDIVVSSEEDGRMVAVSVDAEVESHGDTIKVNPHYGNYP